MKNQLTDSVCNKILGQYPAIPKSPELYDLIRTVFLLGRNIDVMKVEFKKASPYAQVGGAKK